MLFRFLAIALLMLPITLFASGKIYMWTDESGIVHYGDRPPQEVQAEEIAIQGRTREPVVVAEDQLPGQWYGTVNIGGDVRVTLNQSGSITFIQTRPDQSVFNYQGIWTLDTNSITVITEFSQTAPRNGELQRSVEPVQYVYNIIDFGDNSMEWIIGEERFSLAKSTIQP